MDCHPDLVKSEADPTGVFPISSNPPVANKYEPLGNGDFETAELLIYNLKG